jgi:hypothetical protein
LVVDTTLAEFFFFHNHLRSTHTFILSVEKTKTNLCDEGHIRGGVHRRSQQRCTNRRKIEKIVLPKSVTVAESNF